MSPSRSRTSGVIRDDELRLPREPGVIRRFWARHPRFADALIALLCLLLSLGASSATLVRTTPLPIPLAVLLTVLIVGVCVLAFWRRRFPVALVCAAILVEFALVVATGAGGSPLFVVALYTLTVYRSTRAGWIAFGVGLVVVMLGAIPFTLSGVLNALLGEGVAGLIAMLIGINIGNRRRYLTAIIDRSRQLLVERDQQAQLAAAAERDRIAREMHDIVSHSLTVVVALSEGAAATDDRERAREASTAAATTARNALAEMRSMLGVLRDGDTGTPLAPLQAVDPAETVAAAQRAGFAASLTVRGRAPLTPALRLAIGRIVQEGVTNAMRHAPTAGMIAVRIDYDASPIALEIVNDGVAGPASEGGFGLRGLAERASLLGGFVVSAPAGAGRWMLRAELPRSEGEPGDGEPDGEPGDIEPGRIESEEDHR